MPRTKSAAEQELELARKVKKLHDRMLSGNENERGNAYKLLDELLSKHKRSPNDVSKLIALAVADEEQQAPPSTDDDEPAPQGPTPNAFELVDWVSRRFLYLEDHQHIAFTLWILHTHVFRQFSHTPRLALLSPVRGCGKSTALTVSMLLCHRARKFGHTTTAVLPRLIDNEQPTLLLDEADNLQFQSDHVLRSIMNDGFDEAGRRGLVVDQHVAQFNLFAPVAFGAIGRLPLPLMSRSIVLNMHRAPRTAKIERLDRKNPVLMADLDFVYRTVFEWAQQVRSTLNTDPAMPKGFYGRIADRWRALFAIADAVGRGDHAREMAKILNTEQQDEDIKVMLLADIRRVFDLLLPERQVTSNRLVELLLSLDDGQWTEFGGERNNQAPKPLTRASLAKILVQFGILTGTIWPPHRTAFTKSLRGYQREQFETAWAEFGDEPAQPGNVSYLARP
jgi:hypothetical protein